MTKSQVVLDRPIKAIGLHDVKIALHPEVAVMVKVNVARSPEEADLQAQGVDVMAQMFERDTGRAFTEGIDPDAEPGCYNRETTLSPLRKPEGAPRKASKPSLSLTDLDQAAGHPGLGGLLISSEPRCSSKCR